MFQRLLHNLMFILACLAIIVILFSPFKLFNGKKAQQFRKMLAVQEIAPQRLFISSWRIIEASYIDPTMNHQDWKKWKYRYLNHIKTDEDVVVAVNTMLASLNDDYSEFFNKKKLQIQDAYIRDNSDKNRPKIITKILGNKTSAIVQLHSISGIVQSAKVTQESPYFKEPKRGDIILSIDGYKMKGLELNSAVRLIRGRSNLSKVEVLRGNKIINLSLVSGNLGIYKLDAITLPDNVVYISIFSLMGEKAPKDFKKILDSHKDTTGFVIDLRGNVGGLFLNAIYIADEIVEKGNLVTITYRDGRKTVIDAQIPSDVIEKPIVILINGQTASSSEILAGALRSNHKAVLVGEPTYGKNSIQQIIPMQNNTAINLTTSKYNFGGDYDFINGSLMPDYPVPISGYDILSGNDVQLKKACEIIKSNKKQALK